MKVDPTAVNMNSTSSAIDSAFRDCKMAAFLQVDVVEITEEPCEMDVIQVDVGQGLKASHELHNTDNSPIPDGSHILGEDLEMNKDDKAETGIMHEDGSSRQTECSVVDETYSASEGCLQGVEGSGEITTTVESVETVRVPRKKPEWLADWLIEAAEWEGGSWCKEMELLGRLHLRRRNASEEETPCPIFFNGRQIDPVAWQRLREKYLSAEWRKHFG